MRDRKRHSGVRYDRDLGEFQLKCERCAGMSRAAFWPLTLEFWDINRGLRNCRACHREMQTAIKRRTYQTDDAFRERQIQCVREQRAAKGHIYNADKWAAIKADPERHAAWKARHAETSRQRRARAKEAA